MNRKTLIVAASLCAGLLILAVLAFAGSWSNASVSPACGEVGVYYYTVTYCCDPGEGAPNCVVLTVYKQEIYVTAGIMDLIRVDETCHTYGIPILLEDTGNDYTYNFTKCSGGPPSQLYGGPCVVEDKDEDCPCTP